MFNLKHCFCGGDLFSAAVHNPASAFIKEVYTRELQNIEDKLILFTAGGGGVGKSTVVKQMFSEPLNRLFVPGADPARVAFLFQLLRTETRLIYDTTFANETTAQLKIADALNSGNIVQVVYVYRPFDAALQGVIQRASAPDNGRVVPLSDLVKAHCQAPKTFAALMGRFASNENIDFMLYDNSEPILIDSTARNENFRVTKEAVLQFLASLPDYDPSALLSQAKGVLDNAKEAGEILSYIAEAFNRG